MPRTSSSLQNRTHLTLSLFCLLLIGFSMIGCRGCVKSSPAKPLPRVATQTVQDTVDGNQTFALSLYKAIRQQEQKNIFFSPYSISSALTMTSAGAKGATAQEMHKVLAHQHTDAQLHKAYAWLSTDMNNRGKAGAFQLAVANQLWGQRGKAFQAPFLAMLKSDYQAGLQMADFAKTPEASRQLINKWVEDNTAKKIKDLLPKGSIRKNTRLVLTNAIYFKGSWASKFKTTDTAPAPFHLDATHKIQVPMMNQTIKKVQYMADKELQAIALPYKGKALSMLVLLPKTSNTLEALEAALTKDKLNGWIKAMFEYKKVILSLPRFKFTQELALKKQLTAMGMGKAFSAKADFSGINGKQDLYIDQVFHKAFIEVNEEGTEAAAATAVVAATKSASMRIEFKANRPFLFLIRDNKTGSILFLGRIKDPRGN